MLFRSYVGSNGDLSNDETTNIQTNEVIEENFGQVSYVSIDQSGDFRVGDAFVVDQETGNVTFTDTVTSITALSSLTISNGTDSSVITPTSGQFGNIIISANTVQSSTGDINLDPAGVGEVNIIGNLNVIGVLTAAVIEIDAIQVGDTFIAIEDNGADGNIRFGTNNVDAIKIDPQQQVGIGIAVPVDRLQVVDTTNLENLIVTGVSTFVGVATFQNDIYVAGNLNVLGDIVYDEVNGRNLNITGIATINYLDFTDGVGIALTLTNLTVANFTSNGGGSSIDEDIVTRNLVVTGIATINVSNVTDEVVGTSTITTADIKIGRAHV